MIEKIITEQGTTLYYKDRVFHREDGPAVIDFDGGTTWFYEGKRHRDGGPAVSEPDGTKEWWTHGVLQRFELPHPWNKWHPSAFKGKKDND